MISINNREWNELTVTDVEKAVASEEESFYFEFKDDRVESRKLAEEISALANTYGGYLFLGVSDKKEIDGCKKWNEQSIHAMIHDSLSPTPGFDVKKFVTNDNKNIYVIRIEPGTMPPYITSKGKIYERLSSGSFPINDSTKLTQMYYQRENELKRIEEKLTIGTIESNVNNVFGYLDIGFSLKATNYDAVWMKYVEADLKQIGNELKKTANAYSISRVGYSLVVSVGEINTVNGNVLSNLHNFMEVMGDGSVKLRILLTNNDESDKVNIGWIFTVISIFSDIYSRIFGENYKELYISAYKYEKLTILRQFSPIIVFNGTNNEEFNKKCKELYSNHIRDYGNNLIITGDRVPKYGLRVLDKRYFSDCRIEFSTQNIIGELFRSAYCFLGYIDDLSFE